MNLLKYTTAKSFANLPQVAPESNLFMTLDRALALNFALTVFAKEEDFYHIKARFKERLTEPVTVECCVWDSKGETLIQSGKVTQKAYSIEFQLDEPATPQSVQITFLLGKEFLPPLQCYNIYQLGRFFPNS